MDDKKTDYIKEPGKYRYFSLSQQKLIKARLSDKDFKSLYSQTTSKEISVYYLLGILKGHDIDKLGKEDLTVLSKNESEFREKLFNSKNQKIWKIFKDDNIKKENILDKINFYEFSGIKYDFNPKKLVPDRLIEYMIKNKDLILMESIRTAK